MSNHVRPWNRTDRETRSLEADAQLRAAMLLAGSLGTVSRPSATSSEVEVLRRLDNARY